MTDPRSAAPVAVRPDVAQFLGFLNAMPGPKLPDLAPAAARAQLREMVGVADLPAGELAAVHDLAIPGPAGPIPARLFDPGEPDGEARAAGPAVVFFHGGGFVLGDLDTHAPLCAEVARALGLPVVAVDYRLAPEHPWPAAPDDAEAAARWVAGGPAALGRGVTRLVLMGDSAGGNLAAVTALALRDRPAAAPVMVQAMLYPAVDMRDDYPSAATYAEGHLLTRAAMAWFFAQYGADPADPRAAPLLADLAGLPPAVVATAGLDPIRDQGRAYAAALARAGVPVTYREAAGTLHGFATMRRALPSAGADLAGFLAAVAATLAEAAA